MSIDNENRVLSKREEQKLKTAQFNKERKEEIRIRNARWKKEKIEAEENEDVHTKQTREIMAKRPVYRTWF
jgi:hypothetical protein